MLTFIAGLLVGVIVCFVFFIRWANRNLKLWW